MTKEEQFKKSPQWAKIKKSLAEQAVIADKGGMNLKTHWNDMMNSLKKAPK